MSLTMLTEEQRELFVALTDGEVAKYALQAAQGTLDIGELEDKKKAAASSYPVCSACGHPRGVPLENARNTQKKKAWKISLDGEICPACGETTVFPPDEEEGNPPPARRAGGAR